MIDLHVHTTSSDGGLTPTEIIQYAKEKQLVTVAITDHDSISGIYEAVEAGNKLGIEVIAGVELSTRYGSHDIHILGLMVDVKNAGLKDILAVHENARETRYMQSIDKLVELGFDNLSHDDYRENKESNNWNIGKYLLKRNVAENYKELSKRYTGKGGLAHTPYPIERLTTSQAIAVIHGAGGLAIYAHPGRSNFDITELEQVIVDLKNMGLDGIETLHYSHTAEFFEIINNLANKHQLFISGGSDYHGKARSSDLGEGLQGIPVPYTVLETMRKHKVE